MLLYPRWKPKDKGELQGFAVDRAEPLVHFALSSGSHSDPVVSSTMRPYHQSMVPNLFAINKASN